MRVVVVSEWHNEFSPACTKGRWDGTGEGVCWSRGIFRKKREQQQRKNNGSKCLCFAPSALWLIWSRAGWNWERCPISGFWKSSIWSMYISFAENRFIAKTTINKFKNKLWNTDWIYQKAVNLTKYLSNSTNVQSIPFFVVVKINSNFVGHFKPMQWTFFRDIAGEN